MRKLLNILYVTTPEAYLSRDGENVVVRVDDEIKLRLPIHNLEGIVTFGYTGASPALMNLCAERNVGLSFHSTSGKFLAKVVGPVSGNVLLRRRQYEIANDEEESTFLAKNFVLGKIYNARIVLQRFLRDHNDKSEDNNILVAVNSLSLQLKKTALCNNINTLRGIEGDAARTYYGVFNNLILSNKESFQFNGRSRRPPLDIPNTLLSFLYTLLAHDCRSALETVGLDPQVGFLHKERPGRPSLALDLMEELRPYLVDRLSLTLMNNRQVDPKNFIAKETGGIIMDDDTRKLVITCWQKKKREEVIHPFLGEKIAIGLIPHAQAMLLARNIRGDMDAYPPFLVK